METPKFSGLAHMNEFVKPVKLAAENEPGITRIKNHIIDNPGATVRDIVNALGLEAQFVRNGVFRLNAHGHVRRVPPTKEERRVRWEAGPDEEYEKKAAEFGRPKQTTVSTWTPFNVRNELETFLFGPAKKGADEAK